MYGIELIVLMNLIKDNYKKSKKMNIDEVQILRVRKKNIKSVVDKLKIAFELDDSFYTLDDCFIFIDIRTRLVLWNDTVTFNEFEKVKEYKEDIYE